MLVLITLLILTACNGTQEDPECDTGFELVDGECVEIEEPVEFSISLNSATKTITQGESFILVVTLDGITEYDSIGWAADGDLLTIAPNGLNAVISSGSTTGTDTITVTVTVGDVSETADCVVTVNPVILNLSMDSLTISLDQGESRDLTVAVDPDRDETVIGWAENGSKLTIVADGNNATITAGAETGTTTVRITATIFGEPYTLTFSVIVNEIVPYVDIAPDDIDINVGASADLALDFMPAYDSDATWSVSFSEDGYATAAVSAEDVLQISTLMEGTVTLTLTMTTGGNTYTDTLVVNVRPEGYVGIAPNVYDPYDLQLNFTESTYFSSIDEAIWQEYNILLGGASNTGEGDLRGQFIFRINTIFAEDNGKDVIQVMANGMSAIAVKIPDTIDDLAAVQFNMDVADLDPAFTGSWRMDFFVATVVDGNTTMYARATDENNALSLGRLEITTEELLREGYHTYTFYVNELPENAGNWIVIYLGNTNNFNGDEENRTYIDGFTFYDKEFAGIELTTPPTDLEYVVGQDLDPTDLVVSALYTAGNVIPIDHEDLTFDYDFSTAGTKTVTVTYMDESVTFDVTVVEKAIVDLELTTAPDTVVYAAGETFDPAGMVVTAVYNDDSTEVVTGYTYNMDPLTAGTENLVVSYDGLDLNVPITVNAAELASIAVTTTPDDTEYVVGQNIVYDGLVVTATYGDASTAIVPFEELTITGFDSTTPVPEQIITVTYGDQTATFTVDIIARAMTGIKITSYPRVVYLVGESSNWDLLEVVSLFNDDTEEAIDFANLTITGFDSSAVAELTVTVSYMTYDATFPLSITDVQGYVEFWTVDADFPATENGLVTNDTMYTDLFYGDTPVDSALFDVLLGRTLNDGERMLQYSDLIYINENGEIVVSANGMSSMAVRIPDGVNPEDIMAFTISLSGEGLDTIITDTNERWRPSFRFSSFYDGVEYFHTTDRGMYFLPQSGRFEIWQPEFTRTGFHEYTMYVEQPTFDAGESIGNYMLIYFGNDGTFRDSDGTALLINGFKFWTRDAVHDIALTEGPDKTEYIVGETFDPTGLVISPLFGIDLRDPFTSINHDDLTFDYDFSTAGTKTVTISYGDLSVTVDVDVIDRVATSIEITTQPDTVLYSEGDVFDPTGMVVTAHFNDGTSEVVTTYTYDMNPLALEATLMTIDYEGLTADVAITVQEKVITAVEITTPPTKVEYVVGQEANYDGLVVTVTYDDATTAILSLEDLTISGFDSSAAVTDQVITVEAGTQSATFTIDVVPREMIAIDVQTFPQVIYYVGDSADWTDLVVVGLYNDDTTEVIDSANYTLSGFDSSTVGDVAITITHGTFTDMFYVSIKEVQASTDYVEVFTPELDFTEEGLVSNETYYTDLFFGDNPVSQDLYDVLFGRTVNDDERMLQFREESIFFEGEGIDQVIVVNANGMYSMAVRIPDGLTAADITAFTISLSGEGLETLIPDVNERFRPRFRFSSIFDGVEYFHTTDRGTYFLPESGRLEIMQPDFTRAGYWDYTVVIDQPTFDPGESAGNYIIIYMGNDGTFRGDTALRINGFKFWTADVIDGIEVTTDPTKMTYTTGEAFDPTGLVVAPTYGVDVHEPMTSIDHGDLTFDYDFSTAGTKTVTITYGTFTTTVEVTVNDPA